MKSFIIVLMFALRVRSAEHDIAERQELNHYIDCVNVMIDMKNDNIGPFEAVNQIQAIDNEYGKELEFNSKGN